MITQWKGLDNLKLLIIIDPSEDLQSYLSFQKTRISSPCKHGMFSILLNKTLYSCEKTN